MMSNNSFDEILKDWQKAYATHGAGTFGLVALTPEERCETQEKEDGFWSLLGTVPIGENDINGTDAYCIIAPLYRVYWKKQGDRYVEYPVPSSDAFNCFKSLAATAGASLPLHVRKKIPFEPASPVSWWLTHMWWTNPPSEDDLTIDGPSKRNLEMIIE